MRNKHKNLNTTRPMISIRGSRNEEKGLISFLEEAAPSNKEGGRSIEFLNRNLRRISGGGLGLQRNST